MLRHTIADNLELRQFAMEDADVLFSAVDKNRAHLGRWLPWVDGTRSGEDVGAFIARAVEQFEDRLGPNFGIWLNGELVGAIGCHPVDSAHRQCSVGYWIAEEFQGAGIITRCCRYLLDYLFEEMRLHRVEIRCGTGNRRSCAIPEKLGFHREGVLREAQWVNDHWVDLQVWSLLEQDRRRR